MQCKGINNDYIGYLEENLDAETRNRIEQHLLSCIHCREFVSKLKDVAGLIDKEKNINSDTLMFTRIQAGLPETGSTSRVRKLTPVFRVAASVAAIFLGGWMGLSIGKDLGAGNVIRSDYQTEMYYLRDLQQGIIENEILSDLTE